MLEALKIGGGKIHVCFIQTYTDIYLHYEWTYPSIRERNQQRNTRIKV